MLLSGVSMKFIDYDNDGWNDILQLNGAMLDNVSLYHGEVSYKEPLLMFRNLGKGQFEKVSDSLGPDFMRPIVGRGLATADYDNDGDIDIVDQQSRRLPFAAAQRWRQCESLAEVLLIGTKSNRDGIGAVVETDFRRRRAGRAGERRDELHVGERSAHSFRIGQAHEDRIAGNHLAQRAGGQADQCAGRSDHRSERRRGHRAARVSEDCASSEARDLGPEYRCRAGGIEADFYNDLLRGDVSRLFPGRARQHAARCARPLRCGDGRPRSVGAADVQPRRGSAGLPGAIRRCGARSRPDTFPTSGAASITSATSSRPRAAASRFSTTTTTAGSTFI